MIIHGKRACNTAPLCVTGSVKEVKTRNRPSLGGGEGGKEGQATISTQYSQEQEEQKPGFRLDLFAWTFL